MGTPLAEVITGNPESANLDVVPHLHGKGSSNHSQLRLEAYLFGL